MTKLITVIVEEHIAYDPWEDRTPIRYYECVFKGVTSTFSRQNENELKYWVRIAARKIHGKNTKVIFLHKRG